jgi:mRNA-degrading endonuclease RelE of RelBE toxin-antitoxin system
LLTVLAEDPHNRSSQHQIKKLGGLKAGEGQWPIRWHDYRLRYDIYGREVVLHSFRHRKEAY